SNAGTGSLSVQRIDGSAGALTTADYVMTHTAGGWVLQRTDTGATVPMTGSGTAADPFVADGLSIVVDGAAPVGDSFQIRPTAGALAGLDMLITSPEDIAAAAPIVATAGSGNTGTGSISPGEVIDPANPALRDPVTITFISATQYS